MVSKWGNLEWPHFIYYLYIQIKMFGWNNNNKKCVITFVSNKPSLDEMTHVKYTLNFTIDTKSIEFQEGSEHTTKDIIINSFDSNYNKYEYQYGNDDTLKMMFKDGNGIDHTFIIDLKNQLFTYVKHTYWNISDPTTIVCSFKCDISLSNKKILLLSGGRKKTTRIESYRTQKTKSNKRRKRRKQTRSRRCKYSFQVRDPETGHCRSTKRGRKLAHRRPRGQRDPKTLTLSNDRGYSLSSIG
jgi:hypothetical protein